MPDPPDRETFRYKSGIIEALWHYGVHPTERTPPPLVHGFVSDLYRFEIRRLRSRLLKQEFPKREYADRVVQLRMRYRVISMRPHEWVE